MLIDIWTAHVFGKPLYSTLTGVSTCHVGNVYHVSDHICKMTYTHTHTHTLSLSLSLTPLSPSPLLSPHLFSLSLSLSLPLCFFSPSCQGTHHASCCSFPHNPQETVVEWAQVDFHARVCRSSAPSRVTPSKSHPPCLDHQSWQIQLHQSWDRAASSTTRNKHFVEVSHCISTRWWVCTHTLVSTACQVCYIIIFLS